MDYNTENDNELLFMIEENDEAAEKILIDKYDNIIKIILRKYSSTVSALGLDEKDLYQEGLLGLMRAIKTYDKDKNVLFYTYASICIDFAIKSCIRTASTQKNQILNTSCSLDTLLDDEKQNFYSLIKDERTNPELSIISKEEESNEIDVLKQKLAPFESQVLDLKLLGFTNEEIANAVGKEKKSIENTLSRIKSKYKQNN